jgi:hypothetical protein
MAKLDFVLLLVFGFISVVGLLSAILCFRAALKVANHKDGDLKMFFWAVGTLVSLVAAGLSAAYILLPIVFTYSR